jgi:uncharacterized repeat protein (TIGR03803 family)
MKKHLLLLTTLFVINSFCRAQDTTLWGMASEGGIVDNGTIYSYNISTKIKTTKHFFDFIPDGKSPQGALIQASNGLFYGLTKTSGKFGGGVIFSYNASTGAETDLYYFSKFQGFVPMGSLIQASNGLLYGVTSGGGKNNAGVIFCYNIITGQETDLYDFRKTISDGEYPQGSLIQASNGLLYGTTERGGIYDDGSIFSFDISDSAENDIYDFEKGTGIYPFGSLMQADNGLLYGTTESGGSSNSGILFSYNILTGGETDIHDFGKGTDGAFPRGSLIQANNGLLYGITFEGGAVKKGIIFSYDISDSVEINIHDFGTGTDGSFPVSSLIQASNGLLYGMTNAGGADSYGVIFNYNISTATETEVLDLHSASGEGEFPYGALIQSSNGMLYGMTSNGGPFYSGIIFSYDISNATETYLHGFGIGNGDGYEPFGSLMRANNGLLYGMTLAGGVYDRGVIFSYDLSKDKEIDIHDFGKIFDGTNPEGSLIQAGNGLLYGLTYTGGIYDPGTIFSYNISTDSETVLYSFKEFNDGYNPVGSLIQANDSMLFGVTVVGGTNSTGTIFSYNIYSGIETVVYSFGANHSSEGQDPVGSLIEANNGLLYGMTSRGGTYGRGTIFNYDISSGIETDLYSFENYNSDGASPEGQLIQASDGVLYGTTSYGGLYEDGIIFSFNISSNKETILYNFNGNYISL